MFLAAVRTPPRRRRVDTFALSKKLFNDSASAEPVGVVFDEYRRKRTSDRKVDEKMVLTANNGAKALRDEKIPHGLRFGQVLSGIDFFHLPLLVVVCR